ncbi:MAG: hypothetical protein LKJ88_04160 [Bacilli bacterium]|jgi:ATP-dependent Zn protease|nr:hypothetical protein [Bacilli bacterium]
MKLFKKKNKVQKPSSEETSNQALSSDLKDKKSSESLAKRIYAPYKEQKEEKKSVIVDVDSTPNVPTEEKVSGLKIFFILLFVIILMALLGFLLFMVFSGKI